ncbi:MAG: hypothetical protein WBA67_09175, partial [Jannaschia sp.]
RTPMANGISTTLLPQAVTVDSIIGNRDGSTVQLPLAALQALVTATSAARYTYSSNVTLTREQGGSVIIVTAPATIKVPESSGSAPDLVYWVFARGGAATIGRTGSDTIEGVTGYVVPDGSAAIVRPGPAGWLVALITQQASGLPSLSTPGDDGKILVASAGAFALLAKTLPEDAASGSGPGYMDAALVKAAIDAQASDLAPWRRILGVTATNNTAVEFSLDNTLYDGFRLSFEGVNLTADRQSLLMQFSPNGGSTWRTSGYNSSLTTYGSFSSSLLGGLLAFDNLLNGNARGEWMFSQTGSASAPTSGYGGGTGLRPGPYHYDVTSSVVYLTPEIHDRMRVVPTSGLIATGRFILEGRKV